MTAVDGHCGPQASEGVTVTPLPGRGDTSGRLSDHEVGRRLLRVVPRPRRVHIAHRQRGSHGQRVRMILSWCTSTSDTMGSTTHLMVASRTYHGPDAATRCGGHEYRVLTPTAPRPLSPIGPEIPRPGEGWAHGGQYRTVGHTGSGHLLKKFRRRYITGR